MTIHELNWLAFLPIIISVFALLVSWLSYRNSKSNKILSNQPMLEINQIFEESLITNGYLIVSIHNINNNPLQIIKVDVLKKNFEFKLDHGEYSVQKGSGEYRIDKRNSLLVYLYMDKKQDLNHEIILTYRDFENKKRKLKSEKITLENGKLKKGLSGSKFIMK